MEEYSNTFTDKNCLGRILKFAVRKGHKQRGQFAQPHFAFGKDQKLLFLWTFRRWGPPFNSPPQFRPFFGVRLLASPPSAAFQIPLVSTLDRTSLCPCIRVCNEQTGKKAFPPFLPAASRVNRQPVNGAHRIQLFTARSEAANDGHRGQAESRWE